MQDIANRLIADLVPQIGQRPHNPVITPVTVLLGHANDQLLNLSLDPRSARASTRLRAIEFAGDQLAVPGQDGVRPRHSCHLGENLAAQAMTDLSQRGSLGVRELQPPLQLRLQDAVLGGQIFVPRQQLLVHRPRDVGQDARPIHQSHPTAPFGCREIVEGEIRRGHNGDAQIPVFSAFNFLTLRAATVSDNAASGSWSLNVASMCSEA